MGGVSGRPAQARELSPPPPPPPPPTTTTTTTALYVLLQAGVGSSWCTCWSGWAVLLPPPPPPPPPLTHILWYRCLRCLCGAAGVGRGRRRRYIVYEVPPVTVLRNVLDCMPQGGASPELCEAQGCQWCVGADADSEGRGEGTRGPRLCRPCCRLCSRLFCCSGFVGCCLRCDATVLRC